MTAKPMKSTNDKIDEILTEVYSEGIHNVDGKRGMDFTIRFAKQELLELIREARIDEIERFRSQDWTKTIEYSHERLAKLKKEG